MNIFLSLPYYKWVCVKAASVCVSEGAANYFKGKGVSKAKWCRHTLGFDVSSMRVGFVTDEKEARLIGGAL